MPRPYFQQLNVECWEHKGKFGFSQPTICLFHSKIEFGQPILSALEELQAASPTSRRTLTFEPSGRIRAISTLRLLLEPAGADLRVMNIARDAGTANITMTEIGLKLIRDAVRRWCNGSEDFGISPDDAGLKKRELGLLDRSSGELWFWGPTMEP